MGGTIKAKNSYLLKKRRKGGWYWHGQIRYKDEGGRWRTLQKALTDEDGEPIPTDPDKLDDDGEKVRTTRNKRKAEGALYEWAQSVEGSPLGGRMLVADYIKEDIRRRGGSIEDSTRRKYNDYARIIAEGIGNVQMRDLNQGRVRAFVQWMKGRGLAYSTAKGVHALLHLECKRAVENGDLAKNPCTGGVLKSDGPKRPKGDAAKPNALDREGVRRANAMLDATSNDRLRIGARLALACGLRSQECCGLRWCDVDMGRGVVHIVNAIGRGDSEATYSKDPKTKDSDRRIPMPSPIARELEEWRDEQRREYNKLNEERGGKLEPFANNYVIGYADGRFMTPHALSNAWTRLAKEGDADGPLIGTRGRRCTFHDLRHTFATHAVASKADIKSVAAMMGHHDPTVTLTTYADELDEGLRAAMEGVASTLAAGTTWADEPPLDPEAAATAFTIMDGESHLDPEDVKAAADALAVMDGEQA